MPPAACWPATRTPCGLAKGESQAQWELVRAGLSLIEACDDYERQLPEHARSQADLLDFYLGSLREADRLQREFEQAVGDFLDPHGLMHEVIDQARARYRRLAEKVQAVFVKHLETTGWPPPGRLANADVFDRLVADRLKESGRRVAYLMVDALRYELGVALGKDAGRRRTGRTAGGLRPAADDHAWSVWPAFCPAPGRN